MLLPEIGEPVMLLVESREPPAKRPLTGWFGDGRGRGRCPTVHRLLGSATQPGTRKALGVKVNLVAS
jgi:hypothetical protein